MKLLTHNMLQSPGTRNGFPLAIEVEKMQEVEVEFNADFMARMVAKIEYAVLRSTLASVRVTPPLHALGMLSRPRIQSSRRTRPARTDPSVAWCGGVDGLRQLGVESALPETVPDAFAEDEPFLLALHHALMEIEILEGHLVCPETSKKFPIKDGIPSML